MLRFDETALKSLVADLDELRARLDARAPLVIAWEGQLRRDLEAAAVHASVSMEGVRVTVEEVRRILAGDRPQTVTTVDAALVEGYREAMTYVQGRSDDPVFEWSSELIKGIQHRVLAGRRGAGRYGEGRFVVDGTTGELKYTPPQEGVPELMKALCQHMNEWVAHPTLKSAWVHVAFAAIHPFKDGNGRTARILASLAMYRGGFKRPEFCSLEEWWGTHKATYYASFECLGREFDPGTDVTPFVRSHLEAQRSQVRALALREETNRFVWAALTRMCERSGISDRAAFALWDAYNGREITRPYYRSVTDIKESTATADLNTLRSAGLLGALGRTRGRRYVAGPMLFRRIADELAMPPGLAVDRSAIVHEVTDRLARSQTPLASTRSVLFPEPIASPSAVIEYGAAHTTTRTT